MAKITLYKDTQFQGASLSLDQAENNLKNQGFNDKTSSLVVSSGTWNLYQDTQYNGQEWTVSDTGGPNGDGLYPSYKDWNGKNDSISSLKPV